MICAEGVETIDQADFLLEAGCNTLQGYFFGKPKPLETLVDEAKELTPNLFQQAL
jgi:EAL domain-containing protein (putative c-di-GMP-specific phosphodiesterase class I)